MKNIFKTIYILVLCFSFLTMKAQEKLTLSLDGAVSYALDHNRTLINSKLNINKSNLKIKELISQGLPQVSASLDYTNYLGAEASLQMDPSAPPITIEFNPTSNFQASVSQLVFNGSYYVGIQLSRLAKTIYEQSYQKDELNVKEQTIEAYYIILASEKILNIIRENKKNARLIYEKTTNLANAGIIEQTEAKKLAIMVTSIDNALKSTERQVELGYNLLRIQLGLESDQQIELSSTLDEVTGKYIKQPMSMDTFNIEYNIDYNLINMQTEIARKQIALSKANYLPSLVAYYSRTEKLAKPLFDMTPKNVLGLSLSIPIFSSGQRLSQVNQAKIDYDISINTKTLVTRQLILQERQLRYNYNNLYEQYLNQKDNVLIAREVLEKMRLKYQQGIISSLELTSANNEYLTAETGYANILLQLLNAELSLRKINKKL